MDDFTLSNRRNSSSLKIEHVSTMDYRDKEQNEVDIVVENHEREVVGIEVKASATVTSSDFAGLRKLAEAAGKRFATGLVLYDGKTLVPWGPNLWAAPISSLWA